jgi:hypothetical protein
MTDYASHASPVSPDLPWGATADGELTRQGVLLGAVLGTLAVFLTFPLGILGIVLSCMGLDRIQTNPPKARKLLLWSWILFLPGTLMAVGLLVVGVAVAVS